MDVSEALALIDRLNNLPDIYDRIEKAVCSVIHNYFEEMLQVEILEAKIMEVEGYDSSELDQYVKRKKEIHQKYWSNYAQYYQPCSSSSCPDHNWNHLSNIEIMQNGDDENPLYIFKAGHKDPDFGTKTIKAYILKLVDDRLYIEHEFFG